MSNEQSLGEFRVGIGFNPSGDDLVSKIKRQAADLIDLIDQIPAVNATDLPDHIRSERLRLRALAMTRVEEAAMWAVKAATKA